jgi:hypothetical protein
MEGKMNDETKIIAGVQFHSVAKLAGYGSAAHADALIAKGNARLRELRAAEAEKQRPTQPLTSK